MLVPDFFSSSAWHIASTSPGLRHRNWQVSQPSFFLSLSSLQAQRERNTARRHAPTALSEPIPFSPSWISTESVFTAPPPPPHATAREVRNFVLSRF
jgi:hypothetical protein